MFQRSKISCIMAFNYFILFIFYSTLSLRCSAEICIPEPFTGPPLPVLPKQYYAKIEVLMPNVKISTLVEEYYSFDENQFLLRRESADESQVFVDMKHNEVFIIFPQDGTCLKENSTGSNVFMETFFTNIISSKNHVFLPTQIMNLDAAYFKKYSGKTTERGIDVDQWTFCIDHVTDVWDISGEVTWFWKGNDSKWMSSSGESSFPVKAVLNCDLKTEGEDLSLHVEMNYFWWSTQITENIERQISSFLKIPPGIACENKKITKPFPKLPSKMQLRIDLTIPSEGLLSRADDWYDNESGLFRVTYRNIPPPGLSTECTLYTHVYDKNHNRMYKKMSDDPLGFCAVENDFALMTKIYRDNFHLHRIVNYDHFFGSNNTNQERYSYMEERNETDILCEIWAAVREDWPYNGVKTAWEWAFSKDSRPKPVKLSIRIISIDDETDLLKAGEYLILNFYEYAALENVPDIVFDISSCSDNSEIKSVKFVLGGNLNKDIKTFEIENALIQKISSTISVNPLRISRLETHLEEDRVIIFQLLKNDDPEEDDVTKAFNKLCQAVQSCKLLTPINQKFKVWPVPGTLEIISQENTINCALKSNCNYEQYTADVMASLGIGFLVLGLLFGIVVTFIYMHLTRKGN